jgi:Zn-finger protein
VNPYPFHKNQINEICSFVFCNHYCFAVDDGWFAGGNNRATASCSDVQLFENFDEEAQLLIENGETVKVRPQETSRWFAQIQGGSALTHISQINFAS